MSHLLSLARIYSAHSGLSMTALGRAAAGRNWRLFIRLAEGDNCSAKCAEMATLWFLENWPEELDWPKHIPNPNLVDA